MSIFERVHVEAKKQNPIVFVLTVLALPFVAAGWVAGTAVRGAWFLLGWAVAAVKVGFVSGRRRSD